jgi:hypothetical protein
LKIFNDHYPAEEFDGIYELGDLLSRRLTSSSPATLQQRITALRLFYDHLIEDGIRTDNPVGRGRYTPGKGFGGQRDRSLIPRIKKLPWIPNDQQWKAVIAAAASDKARRSSGISNFSTSVQNASHSGVTRSNATSRPIVESNHLVEGCRERGIYARLPDRFVMR